MVNAVLAADLRVAQAENTCAAGEMAMSCQVLTRQIAEYAEAVGSTGEDEATQFAIDVTRSLAEQTRKYAQAIKALAADNINTIREARNRPIDTEAGNEG